MNIYYTKLGKFKSFVYQNSMGELHRENGPAIEYAGGTKEWYQHGNRHRIDGPAIECPNGSEYWYQNGKRHRLNGPAVAHDSYKEWYQNGLLHRLNGPAVELADKSVRYFVKNKEYSKEQYEEIIKFYQEGLDILL